MSEGVGRIGKSLFLQKMIDQSSDLMGIIDEGGELKQINVASGDILGYQPEEMEGRSLYDLVYKEDQIVFRLAISEAIKKNKKGGLTSRLVHKSKKIVFVDWSIKWYEEESLIYVVGKPISHVGDMTVRADAEKELLKVHKRLSDFKFALDESTIVSITDAKGTITHVNDYFCLLSKYSRDELVGRNHNIVNSGFHDRAFFGNLWKTILNGQIWRGIIRNKAKDGSFYWVDNTIVPFLDENGRPYQFIALRIDISERKKAEERILKKSKLLSATTQIVSTLFQYEEWEEALGKSFEIVGSTTSADRIYYFEYDSDSHLGEQSIKQGYLWTQANGLSQAEKSSLKGFSFDELNGYKAEFNHSKSVLINVKELEGIRVKDSLKERGVQSVILLPIFIKKKLEGILGIECCSTGKQWKDDEISFLHTLASKLSSALEKRKGIDELQSALKEKNTILESIGDGFIALNQDLTVSYCNNRAERILCIQRADILGREFLEIFSENLPSSISLNCQKAMEGDAIVHFEEYFPILNAWLDITLSPSPPGLSMFFKDVTERKTNEEKLKKINRELALSNSELEQFAFVASHDLQEPLRMITSFLAQIEKKYHDVLDEKGRKYIYFARDGAKRMRHIILDLLEFSRVGRSDEDKEYVKIGSLLKDIVALSHKTIKEKHAIINWDENLPDVYTFKSPLRLVFQNLIANALKYQKEDTTPILNITCDESDESEWHFIVSDNGIGIEHEYFEKIFIIFQRLHYKNEFSGTGVGLAICKKIIENFGGKIWVVSELGKGSDFHFSLPKP